MFATKSDFFVGVQIFNNVSTYLSAGLYIPRPLENQQVNFLILLKTS